MEHEKPTDFVVNPPVGNPNLEFRAECVKYAEPYVRVHGRGLDMTTFNNLVSAGELQDVLSGDAEKIEIALKKLTE